MATPFVEDEDHPASNPLDVVEHIVAQHEWPYDRASEQDLSVTVAGSWCDYHLGFTWANDLHALQISCTFDLKVPMRRKTEVQTLLALVNERMWCGHFDLWSEEAVPMFRHVLLLRGCGPTSGQVEDLIEVAITECERFYPAFQFMIWGGKRPDEAIAAAILETVGEA
jgi:hypothetical protein